MRSQYRAWLLPVHRWTGLTVGLLLMFLAATGLSLVFRDELGALTAPAALKPGSCAQARPLDEQLATARAAHSMGSFDSVVFGESRGAPTVVQFTDGKVVLVDSCSGQFLLERDRWAGLFGRLEQLHRFRFLKESDVSNAITGTAAAFLALVLVIGGVALWWPARGTSLVSAARLRPHLSGRSFDLNLHRVFGAWGSVVLLMVSFTALPLAFPGVRVAINAVVGSPLKEPKLRVSPPADGRHPQSAGALWSVAQGVLDQPTKVSITFPKKANRPMEIWALERNAVHPEARSYVYMDPYAATILRAEPYRLSSLGNRIYRVFSAIHEGKYGLVMQILEFFGTMSLPVLAWTGVSSWLRGRRRAAAPAVARKLAMKVVAVHDEAVDIRSYELALTSGGKLPRWDAGAHVSVEIEPGLERSYSLCSDPANRRTWRIAVKRTLDSRGGSHALHERFQVGTDCLVGAPVNHFALATRAVRHVLVAGGIGITPLLAMACELERRRQPFTLHYFVGGPGHVALASMLSRPAIASSVKVHIGLRRDQQRRLLEKLLATPMPSSHLYTCGPAGFMDGVREAARCWPQGHVHSECFTSDTAALARPRKAFEVEFRRSRQRLMVPADKSIAEVMHEHGVPVATSCFEGVCGTCATRVLGGECDHRDSFLSARERADGDRILVCVSRSFGRTPLVIDA